MGELNELPKDPEPNAHVQQTAEGNPLWIVAIMVLLLVALVIWYRFKK
jgi:hypothetical protein